MASSSVVRVRISSLLGITTYLSVAVMTLLALQGLETLPAQLMLVGLSAAFCLLYHFVFRTGLYEKNPVIYFGAQLIVMMLMLLLVTRSVDAINFIFLMVSIQAAFVLTRKAAIAWITIYYLTINAAVFLRGRSNSYYAAAFYLVAYAVCGFFGYILQQAELARQYNQELIEELQSTQKKLQELAVVEERNRLARDLHDSVKQQVFAISMQLGAARTSLSETDKSYPSVVEAERLAQQAGAELTTLINALRPPKLESKTLANAIHEHVEEWSRQNKISAESNIDSSISLNQQREQALFRVLQEALANVARHSKADKVTVELKSEDDSVILTIEDNGIGLDSMQERLMAVNGKVEVLSEKAKGTRVIAKVSRLPLW